MKREELLAPPSYNLVSEIEKYTDDKEDATWLAHLFR